MNWDLEAIVRTYADMVYRLAYVRTGKKEDAEDVFQEVFIRLMKHLHEMQSEEHLKYWLIRVTVNCAHDVYHTSWRQREVSMGDLPEKEDTTLVMDHYDMVYEAVCSLPEKYKVPLHLFYYEQLTIKEIAQIMQSQIGTVKSQLSRGRKLLEKKLKEEGYHDGRI